MMDRTRITLLLLAIIAGCPPARAESTATVMRLQGQAQAVEAAGARILAPGDPVQLGDQLRTGPGARLWLRFSDGMELTLGEKAEMVVDVFSWSAATGQGKAELELVQGAFLLETGLVGKLPDHPLIVKTPLASVGVRGTRFWGGPLESPLNVLLLEGRVVVTSPAGSVELSPGQGTGITAPGQPPMPPSVWGGERVARAVATVSFEQ
jgi:ferric-dicitrate binding protein FerR (iron transport regulator)